MPREADKADYIRVQGGYPLVEGKTVIHNYPAGKGLVVPGHMDPFKEKVILDVDDERVEFSVYLLRKFHGDSCEARSRRRGGRSYLRR